MAQDRLLKAPSLGTVALDEEAEDRTVEHVCGDVDSQNDAVSLRVAAERTELGADAVQLARVVDPHPDHAVAGVFHAFAEEEFTVDLLHLHDISDGHVV
jgi:hypothetical protein